QKERPKGQNLLLLEPTRASLSLLPEPTRACRSLLKSTIALCSLFGSEDVFVTAILLMYPSKSWNNRSET
ncbi:hypothetical protein LEMLEM_LOCUS25545, partial [Lemmus lemmus]